MNRRTWIAIAAASPLLAKNEDALKSAALDWASNDAGLEEEAGRAEFAGAIRADIEAARRRPLGTAGATPAELFPNIPLAETNPYLADAVQLARKFVAAPARYQKGPAGNVIHNDTEGWHFIRVCDEGRHLVYALCHPQSPMAGDAGLVAPILRRFAHVFEYQTPGSKNLADFGISPTMAEMYLLLRTAYPDVILPVYRKAWENALETNSDAIVAKYGQVFREMKPGTGYPNAHTHYIVALLCASKILNRPDYREIADSGVKLMLTCLYPDGGTCYIGTQNECFNYHEIAVRDMTRYWQITGNRTALQLAAGTRWYYPLSIEPSSVAEYSTAPSWKPYWNMGTNAEGAAVVANLTSCPHNAQVARLGKIAGNFWIAGMYRPDVKPAPPPDQYITYDRNIDGPRGRFGAFSFSGTSRDYKDDERGKNTFAGCMTMYPAGTAIPPGATAEWPLSAAMHSAGPEVRIKPGQGDLSRWSTHLCLARKERNRSTVTKDFAAVTTTNRLSLYGGPATEWEAMQQWLFTPRRLVGMLSLERLASLERLTSPAALATGASMLLVSGRASWGLRKEFATREPNTLQYGALIVKIHENTFGEVRTEYTDVFSGDTKKSGRIVFGDKTPAERGRVLVEVYPEWSKPALRVNRTDVAGLAGFTVREAEQTLTLLHNPGSTPQTYNASTTYHRDGDSFRVAWLDSTAQPPQPRAAGAVTLESGAQDPCSSRHPACRATRWAANR